MSRFTRVTVSLAAMFALLTLLPATGWAQLTRGSIAGTVKDNSGALMPGVTVIITNNATGQVRTVVTNESGFYRAPALEPGTYTVRSELQGFKVQENREVPVLPAAEATVDFSLDIGGLTETVDVTAESTAVTLNRTNGSIGQTFTSRQVSELPLPGRNPVNIALLAPNVSSNVGQTAISANGQRSRNNNFMIDGTDNNDVSVTLPTVPVPPDSIAEFNVQTNPYNAEFGRNSGAQLNIITKSGTNAFHGSAFDFYSDSDLNARDNIEKQSGRTSPTPFEQHQWGGGLGGPIVRNKAFFYGLFQNTRLRRDSLGALTRVPTPAGLAALQNAPLGPGQTAASRAGVLDRLSFLQDIYNQGVSFQNVTSTQTVNGTAIETGQITVARDAPADDWYYFARGDAPMGNNNFSTRYIRRKRDDTNLTSNTQFGSIFAADQATIDQNLSLGLNRIFGGGTLNEGRFAWIKRDLSFPENDPDSPTATITGLFTIGGASNFPQGRVQSTYQFQDILTLQRGAHSMKVGADIRYVDMDNLAAFDTKGTFTFDNIQAYMNNLARIFDQALQTASFNATQWNHAYFFQDDWRPTSNLTINLGLRYENSTVPFGLFGANEPEVQAALVPGPAQRDNNNWAPRVGFAWSPSASTGLGRWILGESASSIRGGYGKSYDILFYNILTVNGSNYPRVVVGRIDNAQNIYPNIAPVTGAAVFNPLATFVNSPEDIESPESHLWSLSWQREIARTYVWEIGYSGSLGRNGISQGQANYGVLTEDQAATVRQTLSTTSIPTVQQRRLFPQFGSRVLIAATAESEYHALYTSINKRFSNGLQFGAAYTFSSLYSDGDESLALGFTASSPQVPQDYANIDAEWSRSAFDRPHRLVVNWLYEVPWFQGGWAQNAVMRQIFDDWQLAGVAQFQAGQPFTITTGVDSNGNGGGGDRPNLGSGSLADDPQTGNYRTFTNNGAYVVPLGTNGLPLAFSLGNGSAPRNGLRGPGFQNWDLALSKRFRTVGEQALSLRFDFLNAFNQDNYGNPVSNMNNSDFGKNINNWGNRSMLVSLGYQF
jgi:outer membrane receptor protein involved in Fe transport